MINPKKNLEWKNVSLSLDNTCDYFYFRVYCNQQYEEENADDEFVYPSTTTDEFRVWYLQKQMI